MGGVNPTHIIRSHARSHEWTDMLPRGEVEEEEAAARARTAREVTVRTLARLAWSCNETPNSHAERSRRPRATSRARRRARAASDVVPSSRGGDAARSIVTRSSRDRHTIVMRSSRDCHAVITRSSRERHTRVTRSSRERHATHTHTPPRTFPPPLARDTTGRAPRAARGGGRLSLRGVCVALVLPSFLPSFFHVVCASW